MSISHVTDHYDQAVARLPMVYKDKPRYLAWLAAYCAKVQEIEDVLWGIIYGRLLQNDPTGDLLAKLGALVGQGNLGYGDDVYAILVRARIAVNRSDGRRATLNKIVQLLWPIDEQPVVWQFDFYPASVMLVPQAAVAIDPYVAAKYFIGPAVGAGTALSYIWSPSAPEETLVPGSVHASGFGAGPPVTAPDVASGQYLGSIHASGFAAGPPPVSAGLSAGVLAGVTKELSS